MYWRMVTFRFVKNIYCLNQNVFSKCILDEISSCGVDRVCVQSYTAAAYSDEEVDGSKGSG